MTGYIPPFEMEEIPPPNPEPPQNYLPPENVCISNHHRNKYQQNFHFISFFVAL